MGLLRAFLFLCSVSLVVSALPQESYLNTVSTACGSGSVHAQLNLSKSRASTTYPPATAGGTDCIQGHFVTFSAMPQRTAPNVDTLLSEAGALVQAGKLLEAEAATRKILVTHPRNAEAHSLLGVILDQRGQTSYAEKEYNSALGLKPKLVSALSNLGVLLEKTNRGTEAIAKFEEVLRIDPKHEGAIFNLGALYAARGDYKREVPLLEKAAGQDPRMLFTLGLRLAEAHQYAEAARLFQRTNELRP